MKQVQLCQGLVLQHGEDGHWLQFSSDSGKKVGIKIESFFDKNFLGEAILQWAEERIQKLESFQVSNKNVFPH